MTTVTIIIISYNSGAEIEGCLAPLMKLPQGFAEIICIDNASVDDSAAKISAFPDVELIVNNENIGFSAGCNQGAAKSHSDLILFLNPDAFVESGAVEELVRGLLKAPENIAGAGPKLIRSVKGPKGEKVLD